MKYFKFFVVTVLKLTVFLLLCAVLFWLTGIRGLIKGAAAYIIPPAAAAVITWIFLSAVEGGKRSFFAKGYMVENIIQGAVGGILVYVLAFFLLFVTGNAAVNGVNTDFDTRDILFDAMLYGLFGGIAVFGYFFHIIKTDFGAIPAVIISSAIYAVFSAFAHGSDGMAIMRDGDFSNPEVIIYAVNMLLIGAASGLYILAKGDMRSACAFLSLLSITEGFGGNMLKASFKTSVYAGNGLSLSGISVHIYSSIIFTGVMLICCINLIIALKKKD